MQVLALEVDSRGNLSRAVYHEDAPWQIVRDIGLPLEACLRPHGGAARSRGTGNLADGTLCTYSSTAVGTYTHITVNAGVRAEAPFVRLGSVATMERVAEIVGTLPSLCIGCGIAVSNAHAREYARTGDPSESLALRLLRTYRDPMALVVPMADSVAFFTPESRLDRFQSELERICASVSPSGEGDSLWEFGCVCAIAPFDPVEIVEACYVDVLSRSGSVAEHREAA
jgi:hypothetical protein